MRHIRSALARIGAPTHIYASFEGTARLFQQGLDNQPYLILAALLTVYIVLGMLYESTIHPITILSTLPSAGVGALPARRRGHDPRRRPDLRRPVRRRVAARRARRLPRARARGGGRAGAEPGHRVLAVAVAGCAAVLEFAHRRADVHAG